MRVTDFEKRMKGSSKSFNDSKMNTLHLKDKSLITYKRIDKRTNNEFIKLRFLFMLRSERKRYTKSMNSKKMLEEEVGQTKCKMKWMKSIIEVTILMEHQEVIEETLE